MPKFFLGVDGGQTSTVALIGDENGVVIGHGAGGPSNHVQGPGGRQRFRDAVKTAVNAAWRSSPFAARKALPVFESAHFGLTGGPENKEQIIREVLRVRHLGLSHDAITALMGATEARPGIIVIAGTGSISFGMNSTGRTARVGGWGYVFGDEGSAFGIARAALVAALRQQEGWGPPTRLHRRILDFSEAKDIYEAMHKWYSLEFPRDRIASFSQQVDEAARAGDRVARRILDSAAQELALLAGRVRRRLFKPDERALVCYVGGVWKSRIMRHRFRKLVQAQGNNRVVAPALGPAAGALLAAYRNAGHTAVRLKNLPTHL